MERRKMLLASGTAMAAGVAAGTAFGQQSRKPQTARQETSPHSGTHHNKEQQACLDACQRCENICNETAKYCLTALGKGESAHAIRAGLTISCQDFCSLSAKLIGRSCMLTAAACQACAKACDACAAECEKMGSDAQLAACAAECRLCADACRKMV